MATLAFLGTPDAAVPVLEGLLDAGHDVRLVVSRPDRRRGRGGGTMPSPVKRAASARCLAVTDRMEEVADAGVELGVVAAYGRILPATLLERVPMLNVHFSLLPRWRGAAPVERAILAGDAETGVCIMRVDAGLDTGPVLASRRLAIGTDPPEHAGTLTARLSALGADLLVETLAGGVGALAAGEPQRGDATYAERILPEELRIAWDEDAAHLERLVRLDRAWTTFRGRRLHVQRARAEPDVAGASAPGVVEDDRVATGDGVLRLLEVQPEGRRPVPALDWARGARLEPGERLGP